jgi:hypothetical protein
VVVVVVVQLLCFLWTTLLQLFFACFPCVFDGNNRVGKTFVVCGRLRFRRFNESVMLLLLFLPSAMETAW